MAFTQDGISYIGTDGRDSLVLTTGVGTWEFPTGGPAFIEALGDDDQVTFNGNAAEVTLVAGDGADVTMINNGGVTGQLASSSINGNGGDDTTMWFNITNTSIYGGQGNDFLSTSPGAGGITTNASEIQGNKGNDVISVTGGSATFTTVYGGRDNDTITFAPALNAFNNNIQGNKGDDTLIVSITGAGSSDNSVYGGQDDDVINAIGTTTSVLLSGDLGNDIVRGGTGTGSQTLSGGDDRDILIYQGNSATTMDGGNGPDVFRFNAISGGDAPFVADFDTSTDNIEINIDHTNLFFGSTAAFGSSGIGTAFGGALTANDRVLAANYLQAGITVPFTTNFTALAVALTGQLTDGNLFKAANFGQLQARVSLAAQGFANLDTLASAFALGFTQDSRRLIAFTGITINYFTSLGMLTNMATINGSTTANFGTQVIAQFATNNVSGSDIFLV